MDTSIFSDPAKVGPGMWADLHIEGVHAVTDALKEAFIINTNAKCDGFRCKTCQPHFRAFIEIHPFKNYWNIKDSKGRDIGFFKWTWECHNTVNKRLNKYQPSLEEAYEFWSNNEVGACFDCGEKSVNTKNPLLPPPLNTSVPNISLPEQRSRAIPPILTLYRESGTIQPKPFQIVSRN